MSIGLTGFNLVDAKVVDYEPTIISHDLRCDDIFPCPAEIARRVDFWITVFRLWKKENRVFHDANKPERVYTVLETQDECRRKNPKGEVKKEYQNVKARLQGLARLIETGASAEKIRAHRYARLFPQLDLKEIKQSIDSIRCQSGNKEMFSQALTEFKRYQPYVLKVLASQNLPEDIQYLPFVESSYNPKAYSYAGAAGMWQIMPRTARSLGLQVGGAIDERFEPEFATLAAAKYFRKSIDKLTLVAQENGHSTQPADINPFVITSYNYGVRGMQRAIKQVGTDYNRLLNEYKSASFRTAVRNFYASFLAARYVAQNQQLYFSEIPDPDVSPVDRLVMPKPILAKHMINALGIEKQQLKKLNPAMTYRVWRNQAAIPTGFVIKVPDNTIDVEQAKVDLSNMPAHRSGRGDSGIRHRVKKGQTACGIANTYKVRCRDLISLNGLGRQGLIRVGQRLKIPGGVQKYRVTNIVKDSMALRKALLLDQGAQQTNYVASSSLQQGISLTSNVDDQITNGNKLAVEQDGKHSQNLNVNDQQASLTDKLVNLNTKVYQNKGRYWISVLPSESLGLYADWLSIGSSSKLRQLNSLSGTAKVNVDQRIYLPISSDTQKQQFLLARDEYHLNIQLQYFERFRVVSVTNRKLRNGETMWSIARKNGIPLWLLMQYNGELTEGSLIKIPEISKKI